MPKSDKFICTNCQHALHGHERYWFLCLKSNSGLFDKRDKVAVKTFIKNTKQTLKYPKCFELEKPKYP